MEFGGFPYDLTKEVLSRKFILVRREGLTSLTISIVREVIAEKSFFLERALDFFDMGLEDSLNRPGRRQIPLVSTGIYSYGIWRGDSPRFSEDSSSKKDSGERKGQW